MPLLAGVDRWTGHVSGTLAVGRWIEGDEMVNGVLAILAGIACVVFCRPLARRVAPYSPRVQHAERVALAMSVLAGAILIVWGVSWLLTA